MLKSLRLLLLALVISVTTILPYQLVATAATVASEKVTFTFNDPYKDSKTLLAKVHDRIEQAKPGSVIRFAIYSLRNTDPDNDPKGVKDPTANRLYAAYQRGVNVRILLDDHTKDFTKYPSVGYLASKLGTDKTKNSYVTWCNGGCNSTDSKALVHVKLYLFSETGNDKAVMISSSQSLTNLDDRFFDDSIEIANNTTVYTSAYQYFNTMLQDKNKSYCKTVSSGAYTIFYFPSSNCTDPVLSAFSQVKCTGVNSKYGDGKGHTVIKLAQLSWTSARTDVAKKLSSLNKQGCRIQLIYNSNQMDAGIMKILSEKAADGRTIDTQDAHNSKISVHHKMFTINGLYRSKNIRFVVAGNSNMTGAGIHSNNDMLVRVATDAAYSAYDKQFALLDSHAHPSTDAADEDEDEE